MPPKAKKKSPTSDTNGMFSGMIVFFVNTAVKTRRLQIWEQKMVQMGARVEDIFSRSITHVFATDWNSFLQRMDLGSLKCFKGKVLSYQWLEDSLKMGERVPEDSYILSADTLGNYGNKDMPENFSEHEDENCRDADDTSPVKKIRACPAEARNVGLVYRDNNSVNASDDQSAHDTASGSSCSLGYLSPEVASSSVDSPHRPDARSDASVLYSPPDLNRNITEIFGKLIDIYRALGDDRRSFSYYKAIPVIEKLPFKIESADQVKNLPGIGKSLQDHIQEIVRTGKLSKLEHFKKDEKCFYLVKLLELNTSNDAMHIGSQRKRPLCIITRVRTISLFGEVWGIGPATALKLYEKGHRTLDDLKSEESLTNAQRLGLKYFDDIKGRIPRHEVQQMESLLKKVGEEILPGVKIACGGSYRRGKASCGDMDIVITHPDGKSHAGFLPQFVKHLKGIDFLREDLVFSIHSLEGSDSGVDTYFGLCTYPGRELRHRIDLKVYPRDIYAFGLIAWTGNDVLNRRLRLLAESKGFKLDDTGLFSATQSSDHKRGGSKVSASLKFGTEKEVFDFLGFPWLEPNERNL